MEFHYHDGILFSLCFILIIVKSSLSLSLSPLPLSSESESDGNISGEPPPDQKLTKRDIHSINEQKRRDLIKVDLPWQHTIIIINLLSSLYFSVRTVTLIYWILFQLVVHRQLVIGQAELSSSKEVSY